MKNVFALSAAFAAILSFVTVVLPQTRERTILWPPLPVGQIKSAADGIKLSSVNEAVQISEITVAGRSITPGQPFAADEDWLRTLTVRLKNVSGHTIVGAKIGFGLPETKTDERQIGFSLDYGKLGIGGIPPHGQALVVPDEQFDLKFNDAQYRLYLDFFGKHAGTTSFTQAWIGITTVKFDDGSIWSSGCLNAINPNASCPRAAT